MRKRMFAEWHVILFKHLPGATKDDHGNRRNDSRSLEQRFQSWTYTMRRASHGQYIVTLCCLTMLQPNWIWPRDSVPARYNSRGDVNHWRVIWSRGAGSFYCKRLAQILRQFGITRDVVTRLNSRLPPMLSTTGVHKLKESWIYLEEEYCTIVLVTSSEFNTFNLHILHG
jgi:hypothetical protein